MNILINQRIYIPGGGGNFGNAQKNGRFFWVSFPLTARESWPIILCELPPKAPSAASVQI